MTYAKQGSLFVPTRNIWVPQRSPVQQFGPAMVGAIASARRRTAAGGSPTYVSQDQVFGFLANSATTAITLAAGVSAGSRIVVLVGKYLVAAQTLDSIADNATGGSNAYAIDKDSGVFETSKRLWIVSSPVVNALSAGNIITLTWGSYGNCYKFGTVYILSNCATTSNPTSGETGFGGAFNSSPTAPLTTASVNTALVGMLTLINQTKTYASGAWNTIGSYQDYGTLRQYFVQLDASTSGTKDPLGSIPEGNTTWAMITAAYH